MTLLSRLLSLSPSKLEIHSCGQEIRWGVGALDELRGHESSFVPHKEREDVLALRQMDQRGKLRGQSCPTQLRYSMKIQGRRKNYLAWEIQKQLAVPPPEEVAKKRRLVLQSAQPSKKTKV